MLIALIPFAKAEKGLLEHLRKKIVEKFNAKVNITEIAALPRARKRGDQLSAEDFIPAIANAIKKAGADLALGIVAEDLYVSGLNFVFGLASGDACVISLYRLRSANKELFFSRATKEAVHELGHCLGLRHCPNARCVMHFSNSLADTDYKSEDFCERCKRRLE